MVVAIIFAHYALMVLVGLVILAWGGVGLAKYAKRGLQGRPKATDAEMDEWLNSAIPDVIRVGAQQLNVHPTELSDTLDNSALVFVGFPDAAGVQVKRGQDRKLRFSDYDVLVVDLSNWRLPVFQIIYDMEHGARMTETTKEYNLNQVDGVETFNDRISLNVDSGAPAKRRSFRLLGTSSYRSRASSVSPSSSPVGRPSPSPPVYPTASRSGSKKSLTQSPSTT